MQTAFSTGAKLNRSDTQPKKEGRVYLLCTHCGDGDMWILQVKGLSYLLCSDLQMK